jgi:hypothetical protein
MQNRRPLVFRCPDTNLVVIVPMAGEPMLAAYTRAVPYVLTCPCGQQHVFSLGQGYWWRRKRTGNVDGALSDLRAGT